MNPEEAYYLFENGRILLARAKSEIGSVNKDKIGRVLSVDRRIIYDDFDYEDDDNFYFCNQETGPISFQSNGRTPGGL